VTTAPAAALLLGGPLAAEIRAGVNMRLEALRARGITAGLAVITVGEPPSGNPYVRAKVKAAQVAGAAATVTRLPADISEGALRDALRAIGGDPAVHGMILQLPLPGHLHEERHLEDVPPAKDVDGIHPMNVGRWVNGLPAPRPATPLGIQELLRRHCGDLGGKRAVILGRSRIVGRPLSVLSPRASRG
jgi:methylenetetrahydrofolate dehydrogenase (NADP+)/methenyltetrahydrofolate cyclohydrolase